jgi:hypothetical protein
MCDPRRLTILWAFMACYRDSFSFKMDRRKIGWGGINWIDLAQDRDQWRALVNTLISLRVP